MKKKEGYENCPRLQQKKVGVNPHKRIGDSLCLTVAEKKRLKHNMRLLEAKLRKRCNVYVCK